MNFSDRPPSDQWAALMYRGAPFAEVWFKPEGRPLALTVRVPRDSFHIPGLGPRLTVENLLRAVGVAAAEVESWRAGDESRADPTDPGPELGRPLPPPPHDAPHLVLHVSLKPPRPGAPDASGEPEVPEATWHFLEDRWKLVLGLEASMDNLRMTMEGLRSEMDAASRKALPLDVKVHAVSVDLVQWDKARGRIHFAVPKVREFIHRSIWATGTPERKKLAELYEAHVRPRVPVPRIDEVMVQFEGLLKDRQTLYAQGMAVYQECKRICAECQGALRTLEINAVANARRKKR